MRPYAIKYVQYAHGQNTDDRTARRRLSWRCCCCCCYLAAALRKSRTHTHFLCSVWPAVFYSAHYIHHCLVWATVFCFLVSLYIVQCTPGPCTIVRSSLSGRIFRVCVRCVCVCVCTWAVFLAQNLIPAVHKVCADAKRCTLVRSIRCLRVPINFTSLFFVCVFVCVRTNVRLVTCLACVRVCVPAHRRNFPTLPSWQWSVCVYFRKFVVQIRVLRSKFFVCCFFCLDTSQAICSLLSESGRNCVGQLAFGCPANTNIRKRPQPSHAHSRARERQTS